MAPPPDKKITLLVTEFLFFYKIFKLLNISKCDIRLVFKILIQSSLSNELIFLSIAPEKNIK